MDDTAANASAAISGGLRGKIIRAAVDHDRAPYDILGLKTISVNAEKSGSIAGGQKGRKITSVPGMGNAVKVIMSAGGGEGDIAAGGAVADRVNMEPMKTSGEKPDNSC